MQFESILNIVKLLLIPVDLILLRYSLYSYINSLLSLTISHFSGWLSLSRYSISIGVLLEGYITKPLCDE